MSNFSDISLNLCLVALFLGRGMTTPEFEASVVECAIYIVFAMRLPSYLMFSKSP